MDNIQNFFSAHPAAIGALVTMLGLFLFLSAVYDWNWLFGNVSSVNYSPGKIDGLVNLFGRKAARVIFGVISLLIFLFGILIIWLSLKNKTI